MITKEQIENLLAECDENISNGNVNSLASYDEGVRDTLLWLYEDGHIPFVGRED
jgi:hypothetical protein